MKRNHFLSTLNLNQNLPPARQYFISKFITSITKTKDELGTIGKREKNLCIPKSVAMIQKNIYYKKQKKTHNPRCTESNKKKK